jgi:NhaA family Na+:H+ antiporter
LADPNDRRGGARGAAGGIALAVATVVALVWANTPARSSYHMLWEARLTLGAGRYSLASDLRHWVNDGLMVVFFLVVGLEVKVELVTGDLRDRRRAALPALAAAGGMLVPALLFLAVTAGHPGAAGWAVPTATDIAFAVAVVGLLGSRVPSSLRLFLLALAVVDDVGAIVVIAVFYAASLHLLPLALAVALVAAFAGLRRAGVASPVPYVALGGALWLATRASGVHPTIAGVALGLLVRAHSGTGEEAPAPRLERLLRPWATFAVLPVFALANAGVALRAGLLDPPGAAAVTLGVAAGLVVGKVAGISGATWVAVRTGVGRLPQGATWPMVVAVATVAGVGFTVSLFVADLAYGTGPLGDAARTGVLGGSTVAAVLGTLLLARACRRAAGAPG